MAKQDTTLTIYGGINEIGGNKILIEHKDTKVFFDFGISFSTRRQFYSLQFLSPRSSRSLQELGILPRLEGVYKFDEKQPQIDAVFITHGHLDHSAYLSFINREIPVYCGETTKTILQALGEMRRADLEFNVENITFEPFRTGSKIAIGNLEIEPIHVDHSIPGAYGFVINTTKEAVVYTGDFRVHGSKPQMTREFVERAKKAYPVAVITEATNMTGASVSSETEVEDKLSNIVRQTNGIVLAELAYADIDRLNSFYRTAKKSKRCLAVSLKQAYLLDSLYVDKGLSVPNLRDQDILLFRKSKSTRYKWEKQISAKYSSKIRGAFDLSKQQLGSSWHCPFTIWRSWLESSLMQAAVIFCLLLNHSMRR
jgi:ribonuclease J